MNKVLAVLMIAVFALGATACSTGSDGGTAAAKIQQEMNSRGGPN
jgi:hypothetical protein